MTHSLGIEAVALQQRYADHKVLHPKMRIRNVAEQLGVSEMELVAAGCGAIEATPLKQPPQAVFKELGTLGKVMALTRNDWCVHERHGRYEDIRAGNTMGIVLGPDIDLRMFFGGWKFTFAVNDDGRQSLQFFDRAGSAVHKVYLTGESDAQAYRNLVERFADDKAVWPRTEPLDPVQDTTVSETPDGLRADWLAMEDTHEFHALLKKHNVSRLTALQGVGADLAQRVDNSMVERMLQDVAEREIPFMCFVGNKGMIQIHSGPVKRLMRTGPWFNVLEPHFNLHLDTTAIASSWIVNKPTVDGWVTSMECYADNGELIVQFFGARKPGVPELRGWRDLLVGYCPEPLAA